MTKRFLKLFTLLACAILFTACSDSDDSAGLSGDYKGYAIANAKYFSNEIALNQTATITSTGSNSVNISLANVSWNTVMGVFNANINMPLTISKVGDNIFKLTGNGTAVLGQGAGAEYECSATGAILYFNNTYTLTIIFTIPKPMGGMTIEFGQGDVPMLQALVHDYVGYTEAYANDINGVIYSDGDSLKVSNEERDGFGNYIFNVELVSKEWGTIKTTTNKEVFVNDNVYTLTGSGDLYGYDSKYKVSFSGTVDLNNKENNVFTFDVDGLYRGTKIIFIEGKRKTTN